MASNMHRHECVKCDKGFAITICTGCQQWMCFKHLSDHRHELQQNMDELAQDHDHVYQALAENINENHPLYSQIDVWQQQSIEKINQIANEAREHLRISLVETRDEIRKSLGDLAREIQSSRSKDDYTELELRIWSEKLKQLRQELAKPISIEVTESNDQQLPTIRSLQIKRIRTQENHQSLPILTDNTRWTKTAVTVAGGQRFGSALNQLSSPYAVDIDDQGTVFVADYNNHRIVAWKANATSGEIVVGRNGKGSCLDQLLYPSAVLVDRETKCLIISDWGNRRITRASYSAGSDGKQDVLVANVRAFGLALDKERSLYISDWEKHEVRRYRLGSIVSEVVAGGHGEGDRYDQLADPWGIFVDSTDLTIYVADRNNHRVMKWIKGARQGELVAGGHDHGNDLKHLYYPTGLFVDLSGSVYVADSFNHRIVRWSKGSNEGVVVMDGQGVDDETKNFICPFNICIDKNGNVYVVDNTSHRIQRFSVEQKS